MIEIGARLSGFLGKIRHVKIGLMLLLLVFLTLNILIPFTQLKAQTSTGSSHVLIARGADRVSQAEFSSLIAGVSSVCAIGVPGPLWALSENVVPIVSGDEDTTPIPSVVALATVFGNGRVVALGHDGFLTNEAIGLFDNKRFGNNIVDWLDKSGTKKILVTTGHREWYGGANFDSFKQELESRGYTVARFSGQISASSLSGVGVVLIGNACGDFSQQEIDALKSFVSNGGGLLLMGLGWSWEPYNPGKTLDDYPMNKIGEVFGIRWIDGYISDPTNNYNGQPVFHTFYPNIELQTLYQAFSYINTTTRAHRTDLPSLLQSDVVLRRSYVNAHLLIATASRTLSASSTQRREIYDFYRNLINSNPQYFKKNIAYNKESQGVMAWLRERVYRSLIDALPLTEDVKSEIASTLGLTGRYLDIWSEFTVLLLDNNGLDQRQRDFIYTYLSMIPRDLHNLRTISVVDFLGVLPPSTPEIYLWGREGSVNIFGFKIGEYNGNEFPEDVPPKYSDSFCIVVAHEVNHVVDAYSVSRNQSLRERRDELIRRAGENHMNYLRSMLPDGFFVSAPQEFFASIANQWFSDTNLTLRLALTRFDKGYKEPLNQFLFFADVYSKGGGTTLFYSIDSEGNIARRKIPIIRDQFGHIAVLIDGETAYGFMLDMEGNVLSYSSAPAKRVVYTINLSKGYNIISLPVLNGSFTASSLLTAIGSAAQSIFMFNATSQIWVSYDKNLVDFGIPQPDFPIFKDVGYFVYVSQDSSFTVSGIDNFFNRSIWLSRGYNLVGWTSLASSNVTTAFMNFNCVESVSMFNATVQRYISYDRKVAEFGIPQPDFKVVPGQGYFVFANKEESLYFAGDI